ncbi:MAG: PAS domain S-box protein [Methylovulum sp.]|nr:PAS domain S-box protein [Methylovulum sp.]
MNPTLPEEFISLRNSLLNDALLWISIATVPGVALSLARMMYIGWKPLMSVHLVILSVLWLLWLGRQQIPYHARVSGLLLVVWTATFAGLIQLGPLAYAGLFTILFAFIAILFLSPRVAWSLIAGNTLCLMGVAWAVSQHWLRFDLNYQVYVYHPVTWMNMVWSFSTYAVIVALIGWRMIQSVLEQGTLARELVANQHKITANVPGVIYQFLHRGDGSVCFSYVSETAERILGISPALLTADAGLFFARIHADDLVQVQEAVAAAALKLMPLNASFRMLHPQEGVVWIEANSTPERLANGDTLCHGFMRDITALKTAEQRLSASLDNTPNVAVQWYDRAGRVLYWNPASEHIFGWTAAEVVGKSFDQLPHGEELAQELLSTLERINSSGETFGPAEYASRHRDGREVMVSSTIFAIPGGDCPVFVCMSIDITERKQAENSLRLSEEKFRNLFELSPVGIALNDYATGRFLEFNEALLVSIGYTRDEFLALNYWDVTPKEYAAQEQQQVQVIERTGSYGPYEKEYIRKDGSRYPVLLNGIKLIDPSGRALIWSIVQDISERKRVEAVLEHAKSEAEAANRAKSEFLTNMSHELRTPLNAIIGFAQLLEMGELTPLVGEQQEAVGHIMNSGRHLLKLINEILDLARIESGKLNLNIENIGLAALTGEVLSLMRPEAAGHGIKIDSACPCYNEARIRADALSLRQVLLNLLTNAVKYNRAGGSVALSCAVDGDAMRIMVTDTGMGIAENDRAKLFQPFQRLSAGQTAIEGTGIGLVVCKRLVEAMRGEIGFDSQVGVGSQFWIKLPLASAGAATALPFAAQGRAWAENAVVGGRVLYIEDSPINITVMQHVFRTLPGMVLDIAETAETGLAMIDESPPDLVLMDINLPGMSGLDALKRLKADPQTAAIPVIAVSAAAMASDVDAGLAAGFEAYLTKPFSLAELTALVSTAMQKSAGSRDGI